MEQPRKKWHLTANKLTRALTELKQALIAKGEVTDLFGAERVSNSVDG